MKMNETDVLPKGFWEWTIAMFVISSLTASYVEGITKLTVLLGIVLSALLFLYSLRFRVSLKFPPEVICFVIWVIWSIGGLVNVTDSDLYFAQMKTIIQMAIMIAMIAFITSLRKSISPIMLAMCIGGLMVAFFGIQSGEFQKAAGSGAHERMASITGNANEFAYTLFFVIVSVMFLLKKKAGLTWRLLLFSILISCFLFIILSGSRKGFLGVLAFLFLWWIFCKSKETKRSPIKVGLILLLILISSFFLVEYTMKSTHLGKRFGEKQVASGAGTRWQMYLEGFEMIGKHPFLGVGLNNYRTKSSSGLYSHSDYIEVAANTGIVGFVLYFSVYIILWFRLKRISRLTKDTALLYTVGLLKASIITILLLALGRPNITSKMTWIFLAGAFGYSWSVEKTLKKGLLNQKYNMEKSEMRIRDSLIISEREDFKKS